MDDLTQQDAAPAATEMPPPPPPQKDFAADIFVVPLTIELERTEVPLSRIQALQEGAVLALPGGEGRLAVRVLAGARTIATGQIVAIGDAYGVLIDAVHREG